MSRARPPAEAHRTPAQVPPATAPAESLSPSTDSGTGGGAGTVPPPPVLLTEAQLLERWKPHFTSAALRKMRWKGTGPRSIRIERRVFYRLDDVLAYEEGQGSPADRGLVDKSEAAQERAGRAQAPRTTRKADREANAQRARTPGAQGRRAR